jgi:hypothetical protein
MVFSSEQVPELGAPEGTPRVSSSSSEGGSSMFEEMIGWEVAYQRGHNSAVATAKAATTEGGTANIVGRAASS